MSMANLVESARRGTAPIVGIPLEGEKPFAIRRDLLVNTLKGLKVIDAGVQLDLQTGKPSELVVYASGENVKAVRKFKPFRADYNRDYEIRLQQYDWAGKQRIKRKQPKVRTSARQKQIAKLQKQLAKRREPQAPHHPLLPGKYSDNATSMREHDASRLKSWERWQNERVPEGNCEMPRPLTLGQEWARWKQEAHIRRWVSLQGRLCKAGKLTTHALYRILTERGLSVKKWSELRTHDKERCDGNLYGYLRKLWEFCGLSGKPSYWFDVEDEPTHIGPELYKNWLEDIRERKELKSQIENLMLLEEGATIQ